MKTRIVNPIGKAKRAIFHDLIPFGEMVEKIDNFSSRKRLTRDYNEYIFTMWDGIDVEEGSGSSRIGVTCNPMDRLLMGRWFSVSMR